MVNPSSFNPDPSQVRTLRTVAQPQLGRNFPVGGQAQNGAPVVQQQPVQGPAQISASNAPKGAQPVRLMQGPSMMGQAPPPAPMAPAQPMFARSAPPQALPQADHQIHRVSLVTLGSDGVKYLSEFDAVVPRGSTVLGLSEKIVE